MKLTAENVIASKMYVWSLKRFSDPRTRRFWADVVDWIVLINPETIVSQLENARKKFQKAKDNGDEILVVMDKSVFKDEIKDLCESEGISYMNYKVPAWVFTNFDTLKSRIESMRELSSYV